MLIRPGLTIEEFQKQVKASGFEPVIQYTKDPRMDERLTYDVRLIFSKKEEDRVIGLFGYFLTSAIIF